MRLIERFSKGMLLATGVITALVGLSACGPDYTYFRVHITAGGLNTDRDKLDKCMMTITDEGGNAVISNLELERTWGKDIDGNPVIDKGCGGPMTKADIGNFSYSTSRTSGSLTFTVEGLDNAGKILQSGSGGPRDLPCPSEFRDQQEGTCRVDVAMTLK